MILMKRRGRRITIVISGKMTSQREEGKSTGMKTMTEGIAIVIGTGTETDVNATETEKGTEIGIGIKTGTIEVIGKGRVIDTELAEDTIKLQFPNISCGSFYSLSFNYINPSQILCRPCPDI